MEWAGRRIEIDAQRSSGCIVCSIAGRKTGAGGGGAKVFSQFYARENSRRISAEKMLEIPEQINIHKHCRFFDFPVHSHDYLEIQYVAAGKIVNRIGEEEVVLEKGDLLFLNQNTRHSILACGEEDLMVNFIVVPSFLDIPLRMFTGTNPVKEFLKCYLNNETGLYRHSFENGD